MRSPTAALALVGGSAVACALAVACQVFLARRRKFTVLSWNVLAREFTMFNREPPGCAQGHRNPDDKLETSAQTAARYGLATDAILATAPDAVLLQELSSAFFDDDVNPKAAALLDACATAYATNAAGPGTAVLLRKGGRLASTGTVFTAGASEELTGGNSKSASGVLVEVGGARCWIVSVHLTPHKYKPTAVRTHLELLSDAVRVEVGGGRDAAAAPPRLLLGGDLNAEPHEVATLQREGALLGALARVAAPGHTGLSADFARPETIDHLFLSAGLRLVGAPSLERPPASPYGPTTHAREPAPVVHASDHVWQLATVEVV